MHKHLVRMMVAVGLLLLAAPAFAQITVVNVIPFAQSGETDQNSETSIGVNPNNPLQMSYGAFSNSLNNPFYGSSNGGTTWTQFQTISHLDKSITWSNSGTAYAAYIPSGNSSQDIIASSANPATGVAYAPIHTYQSNFVPDQPWIRATQVAEQDHIYMTNNDLGQPGSNTATMVFSLNSGATWTTTVIERGNPGAGQDAPSVRSAVNGNTVYAGFLRWTGSNGNGTFPTSVVVVKDNAGGAGGFNALGALGTTVTNTTTPFSPGASGGGNPPTLGRERVGSDLAMAVDPNNANRVFVAYASVNPVTRLGLQVHVFESTDGGATFAQKYVSPYLQSAQPALAVNACGVVGLLYNAQQIRNGTNTLEQHFISTMDDFATVTDSTLANMLDNGIAPFAFNPYLGDFTDLTAVGNTFYGAFATGNQYDGTNLLFPQGVLFQRNNNGQFGLPGFQLLDLAGQPVPFSIDPYFFSFFPQAGPTVPEPASLTLLAVGGLACWMVHRRRKTRVVC